MFDTLCDMIQKVMRKWNQSFAIFKQHLYILLIYSTNIQFLSSILSNYDSIEQNHIFNQCFDQISKISRQYLNNFIFEFI